MNARPRGRRHRSCSRLLYRLGAAEDAGRRRELGVAPAEEAEELVEAAPLRMDLRRRAEVPLADQPVA